MGSSISALLISTLAVTLAEIGDKTQLLAMCFATRYKAGKVLLGVFLATVINHALAVAAGYFLSYLFTEYSFYIQLVAALSFIGFGIWTIRGDEIDESCASSKKYGPVVTVAIAFFIAEMGDKTQLATAALASSIGNPVFVLIGTTAGMLIADSIGIVFGVLMNKKIPQSKLKWISAFIFAICGILGYAQAMWQKTGALITIATSLLLLLVFVFISTKIRQVAKATD